MPSQAEEGRRFRGLGLTAKWRVVWPPPPRRFRFRSTIPTRLDRLRWSPFHTRMVAGLGAAWILDGLQITISPSVTGVLSSPKTQFQEPPARSG